MGGKRRRAVGGSNGAAMTVNEIKAKLDERGVLYSGVRLKADLAALLEAAEQETSNSGTSSEDKSQPVLKKCKSASADVIKEQNAAAQVDPVGKAQNLPEEISGILSRVQTLERALEEEKSHREQMELLMLKQEANMGSVKRSMGELEQKQGEYTTTIGRLQKENDQLRAQVRTQTAAETSTWTAPAVPQKPKADSTPTAVTPTARRKSFAMERLGESRAPNPAEESISEFNRRRRSGVFNSIPQGGQVSTGMSAAPASPANRRTSQKWTINLF